MQVKAYKMKNVITLNPTYIFNKCLQMNDTYYFVLVFNDINCYNLVGK